MKKNGWLMFVAVAMGAATGWGAMQNVLCSTFPIYQLARNVAQGREGVEVQLLLPAALGCPHHYSLTPHDMKKLSAADVFVVNGLGLEEFLGAPVEQASQELRVVDSSAGIPDVLSYAEEHREDGDEHAEEAHAVHEEAEEGHGDCEAAHGHQHHHEGANPHLFVSPRMSAKLALNIAAGLSKADPEGAGVYFRNASAYAVKMDDLAGEMSALGRRLRNRRIVQPHGVFDYLARDMGLEVVALLQPHGQEPSAAEMIAIVRIVREKNASAVFTEPQYSPKAGQTIARAAGIPAAVLDPAASGPEDASLDYFETVMRQNMEILSATLGVEE
ncbi:MAG: zinc ABC transporter substrate-binding protein [Opitutae bacterium]|nr:zinc ABC transporter substrate-binding protein [Opitutae bacterium]